MSQARKKQKTYDASIKIVQDAIRENPEAPNLSEAEKYLNLWKQAVNSEKATAELANVINQAAAKVKSTRSYTASIKMLNEAVRKFPDARNIEAAKVILKAYKVKQEILNQRKRRQRN